MDLCPNPGRIKHVVQLYPLVNFYFKPTEKNVLDTESGKKRSGVTYKTKGNTERHKLTWNYTYCYRTLFLYFAFGWHFDRVCAPINHKIVVCKCLKLSEFIYRQETKRWVWQAQRSNFVQRKNTHRPRKIASNDLTTKRWYFMACAKCEKNLPVHQVKRFFLSRHPKHLSDLVAV